MVLSVDKGRVGGQEGEGFSEIKTSGLPQWLEEMKALD
jgi:hypothetical protein